MFHLKISFENIYIGRFSIWCKYLIKVSEIVFGNQKAETQPHSNTIYKVLKYNVWLPSSKSYFSDINDGHPLVNNSFFWPKKFRMKNNNFLCLLMVMLKSSQREKTDIPWVFSEWIKAILFITPFRFIIFMLKMFEGPFINVVRVQKALFQCFHQNSRNIQTSLLDHFDLWMILQHLLQHI